MNGPEEAGDTGFDLDSSVASIANGLGLDTGEPETPEEGAQPETVAQPEQQATQVRPPPKSWAKEKHELWSKLPPDAQEYYETREKQFLDGLEQYKGEAGFARQMRDILTPYKPVLTAQGVSEAEAVQYLLNAHYKLTNGTPEERAAFYRQLGADLGLAQAESDPNQYVDPALAETQREVRELKEERSRELRARQAEVRARCESETNAFASDPANVYFNEVAQDMLPFVQAGMPLKDAYDKAVWANPVTRQKEMARLQTEDAQKLKEKAKTEAEAARKATSTNVRGAETRRAPTEPKGTMEDTMRDTLRKIRERAH